MDGQVRAAEKFLDQIGGGFHLVMQQLLHLGELVGIVTDLPEYGDACAKREQGMSEIMVDSLPAIRQTGSRAVVTHGAINLSKSM